jgi:hypothetical protein
VNKGDEGEGVIEVSVIKVRDKTERRICLFIVCCKGGLLDILIDVFDPHDTKLLSRMFFEGKGGHEMKFPIQQPGDYQVKQKHFFVWFCLLLFCFVCVLFVFCLCFVL